MDRIFLDANVLFSAAYRLDSKLVQLWSLKGVELLTSQYALTEALLNLGESKQRERLLHLIHGFHEQESNKHKLLCITIVPEPTERELPKGVVLVEKDQPILFAALAAEATHLLTADIGDFGPYFGKKIEGVLILLPREYLNKK